MSTKRIGCSRPKSACGFGVCPIVFGFCSHLQPHGLLSKPSLVVGIIRVIANICRCVDKGWAMESSNKRAKRSKILSKVVQCMFILNTKTEYNHTTTTADQTNAVRHNKSHLDMASRCRWVLVAYYSSVALRSY